PRSWHRGRRGGTIEARPAHRCGRAARPPLGRGLESPLAPMRRPALVPTEFRVPPVDAIALEPMAAELATRSIKRDAKRQGLLLALRMVDLTTLEGCDSVGKVRALCHKAVRPGPSLPSCAAVCVYPDLVATARRAVAGGGAAGVAI